VVSNTPTGTRRRLTRVPMAQEPLRGRSGGVRHLTAKNIEKLKRDEIEWSDVFVELLL